MPYQQHQMEHLYNLTDHQLQAIMTIVEAQLQRQEIQVPEHRMCLVALKIGVVISPRQKRLNQPLKMETLMQIELSATMSWVSISL
jgi:hypothetical protein